MTAEFDEVSVTVTSEASPPAEVDEASFTVLSEAEVVTAEEVALWVLMPPPPTVNVTEAVLRVLVTDSTVRQPGLYVKSADGEWYPAATFPFVT